LNTDARSNSALNHQQTGIYFQVVVYDVGINLAPLIKDFNFDKLKKEFDFYECLSVQEEPLLKIHLISAQQKFNFPLNPTQTWLEWKLFLTTVFFQITHKIMWLPDFGDEPKLLHRRPVVQQAHEHDRNVVRNIAEHGKVESALELLKNTKLRTEHSKADRQVALKQGIYSKPAFHSLKLQNSYIPTWHPRPGVGNHRPAGACGLTQRCQWPAEEFSEILQIWNLLNILWDYISVSLICLRWIKFICISAIVIQPFLCIIVVFVLFIYFGIKLEGTALRQTRPSQSGPEPN